MMLADFKIYYPGQISVHINLFFYYHVLCCDPGISKVFIRRVLKGKETNGVKEEIQSADLEAT